MYFRVVDCIMFDNKGHKPPLGTVLFDMFSDFRYGDSEITGYRNSHLDIRKPTREISSKGRHENS